MPIDKTPITWLQDILNSTHAQDPVRAAYAFGRVDQFAPFSPPLLSMSTKSTSVAAGNFHGTLLSLIFQGYICCLQVQAIERGKVVTALQMAIIVPNSADFTIDQTRSRIGQ